MTRREGKTTFTVFIIDDDKLVLDNTLTRIGWQENGFEVVGSNTNPNKAVDKIILLQPDVVISDLVMPGLDGVGVFQKLKTAGVRSRFVMLTGLNDPAAKKKFYSLGGFEYLMKPFNRESAEPALERLYLELTRKEGKEPINTLVSTGQQVFDDLAVYIASHLNEDHTLSSLSSRWDIPEERMCALFAEHYQSSLKIFVKKACAGRKSGKRNLRAGRLFKLLLVCRDVSGVFRRHTLRVQKSGCQLVQALSPKQ